MRAIFSVEYSAKVNSEEADALIEMNRDGDLSGVLEFFETYIKPTERKRQLEFLYDKQDFKRIKYGDKPEREKEK